MKKLKNVKGILSRNEMRTISGAGKIEDTDVFCGSYCSYKDRSCNTFNSKKCYCSVPFYPFFDQVGYCTTMNLFFDPA